MYLHIVSALVRCTCYHLILLNYEAAGVPGTQTATYLRSALIENNQCMSVMAAYCADRQIMLLRHTNYHICTDRQKQMQLITTCIHHHERCLTQRRHSEARQPTWRSVCVGKNLCSKMV